MYINKPSGTKIEAADRINLLHSTINRGGGGEGGDRIED